MKIIMHKWICSLIIAWAFTFHASAVVITQTFSFTGINMAVPDGLATGTADIQSISSSITSIDSMTVDLNISGTYNGDLYVYLQHDTGLSILLNRVGQALAGDGGFDNDGFSITLDDTAATDIHTVNSGGGLVSGTYQPDGRDVSPLTSTTSDARLAPLSVFNGAVPSGSWTLFAADLIGGDPHTINDWALSITGDSPAAVPEPRSALPLLLLGLVAWRRFCASRRSWFGPVIDSGRLV